MINRITQFETRLAAIAEETNQVSNWPDSPTKETRLDQLRSNAKQMFNAAKELGVLQNPLIEFRAHVREKPDKASRGIEGLVYLNYTELTSLLGLLYHEYLIVYTREIKTGINYI